MPDLDYCPVCEGKYVTQCRCLLSNRRCASGHEWHRCAEHGVIAAGSGHGEGKELNRCTCKRKSGAKMTDSLHRLPPVDLLAEDACGVRESGPFGVLDYVRAVSRTQGVDLSVLQAVRMLERSRRVVECVEGYFLLPRGFETKDG